MEYLQLPSSRPRNVTLQGVLATYLAEGFLVRRKEGFNGVVPRHFCLHAVAPELTHSLSFRRMIEQPKDVVSEIRHAVFIIAIERCLLGTNPTFL